MLARAARSPSCPQNNPDTLTAFCNEDEGTCTLSVCETYDGVDCTAELTTCEVGCRGAGWGNGTQCISTYDIDNRPAGWDMALLGDGISALPGDPCANFQGYCNQQLQCVEVRSQDLLDELQAYLDNLSFGKIWAWISDDWARSIGILAAIVVVCIGLYMTRQRTNFRELLSPTKSRSGEYEPLQQGGPRPTYSGRIEG